MLRYFLQWQLHCRETAVNMSKYFLKMPNVFAYIYLAEVEIHLCLKHYYATLRLHAGYWFICSVFLSVSSFFKVNQVLCWNSIASLSSVFSLSLAVKWSTTITNHVCILSGKSWILEQNYFFLSRPITATKTAGFPLWVWHRGPLGLWSNWVLQCSHGKCSWKVSSFSAILFLWNSK